MDKGNTKTAELSEAVLELKEVCVLDHVTVFRALMCCRAPAAVTYCQARLANPELSQEHRCALERVRDALCALLEEVPQ